MTEIEISKLNQNKGGVMTTKKKSAKTTVAGATKKHSGSKKASSARTKGAASAASAPANNIQPPQQARDPRLPVAGSVLQKLDRYGQIRCECVVEEDGVRYGKVLHRSLSAAASAAAKDLNIKGNQNGFLFWGLSKPTRPNENPLEPLEKPWVRYAAFPRSLLATAPTD